MEELIKLKRNKKFNKRQNYYGNYAKITKFKLKILLEIIILIILVSLIFSIIFIINYLIKKQYNFFIKEDRYDRYTPYIPKIKDDSDFSKYEKILPHLSPDLNISPSALEQIFNSRELYISDVRITTDYIRYIRFINEAEEEKY